MTCDTNQKGNWSVSTPSYLALMQLHVETLFVHDGNRQLLFVNEPFHPEDHPAPLVFIGRTNEGFICRYRHDLPAELCDELKQLATQYEGVPFVADSVLIGKVRQRLEMAEWRIGGVWEGPAYCFPAVVPKGEACVVVDSSNAGVLRQHFCDIIAELDAVQPCVAAVVKGNAVSICRTVRRSLHAAEAGVNTIVTHRRRGLGTKVVAKWASLVQDTGLMPMYSTSWDNVASRGLAAKLGLVQYGTDLHLSEASSEQ
ncbi:GNAT family N-acetyltransferase [Candidatus Poribacteria bacterium]|nr:GNAT family N-acetyltransferase [Candidatus Poribacteria bacterium]